MRAIGQCAIRLERAAERCVDALLDLIKTKVNYVVQEAVVVIRDIFRKYPGKYEIIIADLCDNLDSLDEPEAKGAMIWIIGEYAERIDNSVELLESFMEAFHDEPSMVQLQLLTATVKLCLKCPQASKELVGRVLKVATDECNNPDLRDRGYMYWRMLSKNPELARRVVLSERPTITEDSFATQPRILDRLIANISTLASVYHQVPEAFLDTNPHAAVAVEEGSPDEEEEDARENLERVQDEIRRGQQTRYVEESGDEGSEGGGSSGSSSGDQGNGHIPGTNAPAASSSGAPPPPPLRPMAPVLSEHTPGSGGLRGLRVAAAVVRGRGGAIGLQLMVGNFSQQPMSGWAVQFNKSPFGLAPSGPLQLGELPPNGGTAQTLLGLTPNQLLSGQPPSQPLYLEVAIKTSLDVFYLSIGYDLSAVLIDGKPLPQDQFQQLWQRAPPERKARCVGQLAQKVTPEMVIARLQQYYCYLTVQTQGPDSDVLYVSAVTTMKLGVLCEISLQRSGPGIQLVCHSDATPLMQLFQSFMSELLRVRWTQGASDGGPPG